MLFTVFADENALIRPLQCFQRCISSVSTAFASASKPSGKTFDLSPKGSPLKTKDGAKAYVEIALDGSWKLIYVQQFLGSDGARDQSLQ